MDRDEVPLPEHALHAVLPLGSELRQHRRRRRVRVVEDDPHVESEPRAPRDRPTDSPQPDQAERLAAHPRAEHVGRPPTGPGAAAHVPLGFPAAARDHEHQHDGVVRRVVGAHVGRVGDDQTASPRRGDVDVVEPHAEVGEDPGAQRLGGEYVPGDAIADRGKERVGPPQGVLQLGGRERAVGSVQAGVELALQLLLDRCREPPRDDDARTTAPPGAPRPGRLAHRWTSTRRDGCCASTRAAVAPSSAALGATVAPASRKISAFSAAVSPNAEMIAPACPMRRPLGAVSPATYPTTGFVMVSFTNSAASASWGPPISPIIITASVSGSSSNSASMSTNELPLMGSPPMPTLVVMPTSRAFIWDAAS